MNWARVIKPTRDFSRNQLTDWRLVAYCGI